MTAFAFIRAGGLSVGAMLAAEVFASFGNAFPWLNLTTAFSVSAIILSHDYSPPL
jgi:hypothetical protein